MNASQRDELPDGFPDAFGVEIDPTVREDAAKGTIIGGVPLRILRFRPVGMAVFRSLAAGESPRRTPAVRRLLRQLTDAEFATPVPPDGVDAGLRLGVVVPVLDGNNDAIPSVPAGSVVVHDGPRGRDALVERCRSAGLRVEVHEENRGPAAARNSGVAALGPVDAVLFVDADVDVDDLDIARLARHLLDPAVGAVAPRVLASPGSGLLHRFEAARSPLDLGDRAAGVRPDGRVGHVPTAALLVRTSAFEDIGGFDESLRFGEDVDLVWRLHEAGWRVRYDAEVTAVHEVRPSWAELLRQRRSYGSAAAPLEARHPGAVTPLRINVWSAIAWLLLLLGGPRLRWVGPASAFGSVIALRRRLDGVVTDPGPTAARLGGLGTLHAGRWLGHAVWRAWSPALLAGAVVSRRLRRMMAVAALGPSLLEWIERRPAVDPVRWAVLRAGEDLAYAIGVWQGCLAEGSVTALRPRFTGVDGLPARGQDEVSAVADSSSASSQ